MNDDENMPIPRLAAREPFEVPGGDTDNLPSGVLQDSQKSAENCDRQPPQILHAIPSAEPQGRPLP
jgi:hypothetical protein